MSVKHSFNSITIFTFLKVKKKTQLFKRATNYIYNLFRKTQIQMKLAEKKITKNMGDLIFLQNKALKGLFHAENEN